jgi:hypothetical protein
MGEFRNGVSAPVLLPAFLAGGAFAGMRPKLAATDDIAMFKASQASVGCKPSADGHNCQDCLLALAPSGCMLVEGAMSSDCCCRAWLGRFD